MIEHILIVVLLCLSVHSLTREHSVFGFWSKIVYDKNTLERNSILFEPISECLGCMASFWTCAYLFVINSFYLPLAIFYFIVVFISLLDFVTSKKFYIFVKDAYLAVVFYFLFCFFSKNAFILLFCANGALYFLEMAVEYFESNKV